MAGIILRDVTKIYDNGMKAVDKLNLEIKDGEFIVLVGPSGCGKTTALRMVAGLEEITSGTIAIADRVVNDVDPGDRDIAMVFQNYALYPNMSVFDNIAFPLQSRKVSKAEIRERVEKVAALLDLTSYLLRKPRTLSGGQRQRVAMGRALVREPQAFLMDEPLSNLDAKLRVQMRSEISTLQAKLGITTIYVTHDQVEAMTMGTKIAVMRLGVLQQYGSPQEVYTVPANIFVASFIGSPAMNFVKVKIQRDEEHYQLAFDDQTVPIPERTISKRPALTSYVDHNVVMGIRPEHLIIGDPSATSFKAQVTRVEMLGAELLVYVTMAGEPIVADGVLEALDADQTTIDRLEADRKDRTVNLVAQADSELAVAVGDVVDLSARPGYMYFFALEGGKAIID